MFCQAAAGVQLYGGTWWGTEAAGAAGACEVRAWDVDALCAAVCGPPGDGDGVDCVESESGFRVRIAGAGPGRAGPTVGCGGRAGQNSDSGLSAAGLGSNPGIGLRVCGLRKGEQAYAVLAVGSGRVWVGAEVKTPLRLRGGIGRFIMVQLFGGIIPNLWWSHVNQATCFSD